MATTTRIEWADATTNTAVGCSHCSPGCDEAGTAIYMALHGYEWGDTAEPQQIKEAACQTLNRAQNVVALQRPSQGQAV